jgi:hypothetical protein
MPGLGRKNPRNIKAMVAAGMMTQAEANKLLKKQAANKAAKTKKKR